MLLMPTIPDFLNHKFLEWQYKTGARKTLDDFAEYVGVSRPLLSQWMSGRKKPGPENQKRLIELYGNEALEAFGIDPDLYSVQDKWNDLSPEERRATREDVENKAAKRQTGQNETKRSHEKRRTSTP
jgi:transcriptional regulator with XRE-family HTH domain